MYNLSNVIKFEFTNKCQCHISLKKQQCHFHYLMSNSSDKRKFELLHQPLQFAITYLSVS